ncbi:MAG: M28 family peptidase [Bacteroidetes bacterium]|nr:M28 family peptidase [Bacteroidota bacterium]
MEELLNIKKRFSRSSKRKFLNIVENKLIEYGYKCETKTFWRLLKSVNLETKIEKPEYIFIAHYDTGTIMPFWVNWLMKLIGINRQLLIALLIVIFIKIIIPTIDNYQPIVAEILSVLFLVSTLTIFIPNSKNYDDNTSGVITLLQLAKQFKEKGIQNVKFIFVDNEELGLFGSFAHKRYLKRKKMIPENCKIISIDCVGGNGKLPLIIRNGKSEYENTFKKAIENEFNECKSIKMMLPVSDNFSFKKYGAINISFVDKTIIPNGYYIRNIHSLKDKEIDIEKIERLCNVLTEVVNDNNSG